MVYTLEFSHLYDIPRLPVLTIKDGVLPKTLSGESIALNPLLKRNDRW